MVKFNSIRIQYFSGQIDSPYIIFFSFYFIEMLAKNENILKVLIKIDTIHILKGIIFIIHNYFFYRRYTF